MKPDEKKKLINRINRAEGQIKALKKALEKKDDIDCKEFITQIRAARSALKSLSEEYITKHINKCQKLPAAKRDKYITEAVKLLSNG